jgi:hypothetical protein
VTYDTSSTGSPSVPREFTYPAAAFSIKIGDGFVGGDVAGVFRRNGEWDKFLHHRDRCLQHAAASLCSEPAREWDARQHFPSVNGAEFPQRRAIADRAARSGARRQCARGNIIANSCECLGTGPGPDANYQIAFSITSMTEETAIPEPSALASFGTMLLVFAWLGRGRRRKQQ